MVSCCYKSQRIMSATVFQYTSLLNQKIAFSSGAFSAFVGSSNKHHKQFLFSQMLIFFLPTRALFLFSYQAIVVTLEDTPMPKWILCLPFRTQDLRLTSVGSRALKSGQVDAGSFGLTAHVGSSSQPQFL